MILHTNAHALHDDAVVDLAPAANDAASAQCSQFTGHFFAYSTVRARHSLFLYSMAIAYTK
jgi:hypothetical protein